MDFSSSADTGSGETGVSLNAHATGNPFPRGSVTSGHTWLIIVLAVALLWALGHGLFKGVRM